MKKRFSKRALACFLALLFLASALSGCGGTVNVIPAPPTFPADSGEGDAPAVEGLRLNLEKTTLEVGASALLSPTVLPLDAGERAVSFSSSDETIVRVNGRGRITGVSRGTAVVTAATEGGFTASCTVEVTEREHHVEGEEGVRVESVTISETSLSMQVGDVLTLTASVLPENAQNQKITWINSNSRSILLEDDGKITAVGAGRAVVTAIAEDGGKSAACEIVVTAKLQKLLLSSDAVTLAAGAALQLTAIPEPADLPNLTLTFRSSSPSVATVNSSGLVTARSPGTTTVSVSGSGMSASCTVRVTSGGAGALAAVTVEQSSLSLTPGESMTLFVKKIPGDAPETPVFTSGDPSVAFVSDTGIVTAIKPGETTVTVRNADGSVRTDRLVTVREETVAHKIYVSKNDLSLTAGESFLLEYGLSGHPEEGEKVLFFSSHPEVATVDDTGRIRAIMGGSTVVSAVLSVSGYTAVCNLSVQGVNVESVRLDAEELTLRKGERHTFTATVSPADASVKTVTFFSSDPGIATVTDEGLAVAYAEGDTVITVQTLDGRKTARCLLHVVP